MSDYQPGTCNISRTESWKRYFIGFLGIFAMFFFTALFLAGANRLSMLGLILVSGFIGFQGFFQGRENFCVAHAKKGTKKTGSEAEKIVENKDKTLDSLKADIIVFKSLGASLSFTMFVYFLSVFIQLVKSGKIVYIFLLYIFVMIREIGPIFLIPAAWGLTFLTTVYPGVDEYWIRHMHYFITLFLAGFVISSWRVMSSPVLKIWKNIILAGVFFTGAGALSFHLTSYSGFLAFLSLSYWFLAPSIGAYKSSNYMSEFADHYRFISYLGILSLIFFSFGYWFEFILLEGLGLIAVALSQTASILIAARLDENF